VCVCVSAVGLGIVTAFSIVTLSMLITAALYRRCRQVYYICAVIQCTESSVVSPRREVKRPVSEVDIFVTNDATIANY